MRFESTTKGGRPAWHGGFFDHNHLLPGGVKLNLTGFPEERGGATVQSGTLVSRAIDGGSFGPFDASHAQFGFIAYDVRGPAKQQVDAELYISGPVRIDRLPVSQQAAVKAAADAIKQQFQLTNGGR